MNLPLSGRSQFNGQRQCRTVAGLGVVVLAMLSGSAVAAVDYLRDVKPILQKRCLACHGAVRQKGGLRLDTAASIRRGGDEGPAISPGNAAASLLIQRVTEKDPGSRMPFDDQPLAAQQIAILRAWIDAGAPAPKGELPGKDPRGHWAFLSVTQPPLPAGEHGRAVCNPIDAFINNQHRRRALVPVAAAGRDLLLRRVFLDLTGLAPTRQQLHRFRRDKSPDAYERVIDRLLASPQYGERWGRHWMDVWRYSDAHGILGQRSQKQIWNWRDWIVESLNADDGLDRMILQMLAADELDPTDLQASRATGFVARNYFHFDRDRWLDDIVEHTSKAFLGLTINCCRCHDHKFDPLAQSDYYALRAVFEPHRIRMLRLPNESGGEKRAIPRIFDADPHVPTWLYEGGAAARPRTDHRVLPGVPAFLDFSRFVIEPVPLPGRAHYPALRPWAIDETLAAARAKALKAQEEFAKRKSVLLGKRLETARAKLASLEARIAADVARYVQRSPAAESLARAASAAESASQLVESQLTVLEAKQRLSAAQQALRSGEDNARAAVMAAEVKLAEAWSRRDDLDTGRKTGDGAYSHLGRIYAPVSSGRRLALARWIIDPGNPLTARVAVNHIWLRHFGRPLVPTVFDFGLNGRPPSHPDLLDWLSSELIARDWSMKWLHRVIVTSEAYRRGSSARGAEPATQTADPQNVWLWRMNGRRMESQVIRDNVLSLTGQLDLQMEGPALDHKKMDVSTRRSLYFRHSEKERGKFVSVFDDASVNECYRREASIVPQQALAMANSRLVLTGSRRLARALTDDSKSRSPAADVEFVTRAFETVLSRAPTEAEVRTCTLALQGMRASLARRKKADPRLVAREHLIHVLFNHNDFVTVR